MVMGRQRTRNFQGGFLQLGKKKLQELACYPLIMCAGKCIFPGEQLEQVVAVIRIRQGKGDSLDRERGNIFFIRIETQPVIFISVPAVSVINRRKRREKDCGFGRVFLQAAVHPEKGGGMREHQ